jgi:hypothetical protein
MKQYHSGLVVATDIYLFPSTFISLIMHIRTLFLCSLFIDSFPAARTTYTASNEDVLVTAELEGMWKKRS